MNEEYLKKALGSIKILRKKSISEIQRVADIYEIPYNKLLKQYQRTQK